MELYATKTIKTRYIPPTNLHGAKIKASDGEGNNATIPFNSRLDTVPAHLEAVKALCEKMDWTPAEDWRPGAYKNNYYWILP